MNEELMTLCRLNNVGLYCSAHGSEVRWHACESINGDFVRSGFGESPEVAIADCKTREFQPLKEIVGTKE